MEDQFGNACNAPIVVGVRHAADGDVQQMRLSRVESTTTGSSGVWKAQTTLKRPGHYTLTCSAAATSSSGNQDDGGGVLLSAAIRCAPGRVVAVRCVGVGEPEQPAKHIALTRKSDASAQVTAGSVAAIWLALVDDCDNVSRLETTRTLSGVLHRSVDESSNVSHAIDVYVDPTLPNGAVPLRFFPTRPGSYDVSLLRDYCMFCLRRLVFFGFCFFYLFYFIFLFSVVTYRVGFIATSYFETHCQSQWWFISTTI